VDPTNGTAVTGTGELIQLEIGRLILNRIWLIKR